MYSFLSRWSIEYKKAQAGKKNKLQYEEKAGSTIFLSVAGFSRFGGKNYLY